MKNNIIERLLNEGHITIEIADKILNNKWGKVAHIADLRHDSIVTNYEAITLLRDDETPSLPFGTPNQTFTMSHHNPDWINNPSWNITCTNNLDSKL